MSGIDNIATKPEAEHEVAPMTEIQLLRRFKHSHPKCNTHISIMGEVLRINGELTAPELFTLFLLYSLYCSENGICPTL